MTPEEWADRIVDDTAHLPPELDALRRERVADAVRAVMGQCAAEADAQASRCRAENDERTPWWRDRCDERARACESAAEAIRKGAGP